MKQYRTHLLVCAGTGCVSCGSFKVKEALEKEIKAQGLDKEVQVVATGCNGFCERGPIVLVQPDGIFYQHLKIEDVPHLVEEHLLKGRPVKKLMYVPPAEKTPVPKMKDIEFFKHQRLIVLRNRGRIDPEKIEEYIAFDGYEAMGKALTEMTPEEIIDEITLLGPARAAAAPGSRRARSGRLCAPGEGVAQVPHLQRRRGRSRRVHGPVRPRGRPPRRPRRHGHRGQGHRGREGLRLHPPRISRWP